MFRRILINLNKNFSNGIKLKGSQISRSCSKLPYDPLDTSLPAQQAEYARWYQADEQPENDFDRGLIIHSYSEYGFRLNDKIKVIGPMALFPKSVFAWNVGSISDINEDSLCIFHLIQPKIDILIIGTGDQVIVPEVSRQIMLFMQKYGINVEIHSTEQACSLFNYFNRDGRMVAAALIPPVIINFSDDDRIATQARNRTLFQINNMEILHQSPKK